MRMKASSINEQSFRLLFLAISLLAIFTGACLIADCSDADAVVRYDENGNEYTLENKTLTIVKGEGGNGIMGPFGSPYATSVAELFGTFDAEQVIVSDGITIVSARSFFYCSTIKTIILGDSVKDFKESIFDCPSLESMYIGAGVEEIHMWWYTYIFSYSENVTYLDVSESNPNFMSEDGIIFSKSKDKLVAYPPNHPGEVYTVPDCVTTLGPASLMAAKNLKKIIFTEKSNIETLDVHTLSYLPNVTEIDFGVQITNVYADVFSSCGKLDILKLDISENGSIGPYNFATSNLNLILTNPLPCSIDDESNLHYANAVYLPYGAKDTYLAKSNWSYFKTKLIENEQADVPQAVTGLSYTGLVQTGVPTGTGFDLTDNTGTDARDYTACVKLQLGYEWKDGSLDDQSIEWSIAKADITEITTSFNPTFTGSPQLPGRSDLVYTGFTVSPADGCVTITASTDCINAGSHTVSVSVAGDDNFNNYAGNVTYYIEKKEISASDFKSIGAVTFTGSALEPAVTPISPLTADDYDLEYSENINAGIGKITVAAKNNYKNPVVKITLSFTINPKEISASDFVSIAAVTFTGSALEPAVTPISPLTADDYTLAYSENINAGIGKITVTAKNNYKDPESKVILLFTINKATITGITTVFNPVFNGSPQLPGKSDLAYTGFTVSPADGKVSIAPSALYDCTAAGEQKVTVSVTGDLNFNDYVGDVAYTIERKTITADMFEVDESDKTYTGDEIRPEVESVLIIDSEYTVGYSDNIVVGQASINILGEGNYDGTLLYHFNIVQLEIAVPEELYFVETGEEIEFDGFPISDYFTETTGNPLRGTEPGTYSFVLTIDPNCVWSVPSFTGDYNVYITELYKEHTNEKGKVDVQATTELGVRKDVQLVVSSTSDESEMKEICRINGKARLDYTVSFFLEDEEIQPQGTVALKLLIPGDLIHSDFRLYHIHGGTATQVDYLIDGQYAIVSVDNFSDFMFVVDENTQIPLFVIVGAVIIVMAAFLLAGAIFRK